MLFVGIDGGGTKTDAVLFNEYGHVLNRVKGGPSSPTSLTPQIAAENIRKVLEKLLACENGLNTTLDSVFAGLSGGGVGDNPAVMHTYLEEMLPNCRVVRNYNDAINALRSVFPSGDAMIVIAGTGSSVFACVDDEMHQVGGWGYLLGDEGSGYDLGKRALASALRQIDGRGPETSLTAACRERLGKDVHRAIPQIYAGGRAGIADFATITLQEAEKGDRVAEEQLAQSVEGLVETIRTAAEKIQDAVKYVATAGSIWKSDMYRKMMEDRLGTQYQLCSTDLPPVFGSCVIAFKNADLNVTEDWIQNFRSTLTPPVEIE